LQKFLYLLVALLVVSCADKGTAEPTSVSKKTTNSFYEKACAFLDQEQQDSAFVYYDKARILFLKKNDSFGVGKSLINMAIIQESEGDNFGSIETSLSALDYLHADNKAHHSFLFSNYNNLGVASNNLKNYQDALNFYEKALTFTNDPIDRLMIDNNLAIAYHNQKQYAKAVGIYKKLVDSLGSGSEFYPKLLLNYSRSQWYQNPKFDPIKNYHRSITLSKKSDDRWTRDAAYAFLSDYYLNKNPDSSRYYAKKMLTLASQLKYPADQLEALQNLIKLSDGQEAQHYFDRFSKTQDSLINSQNKAKNQFALIRFESEKAKADNLLLQKEHAVHEYKMERQKLVIWFLILFFTVLVAGAVIYVKRRRERLLREADQRLQHQRLDFSKKVHDVVANGLYEVMMTIENQNDIPKEKILDKLELMYEQSRDLSYNRNQEIDFKDQIFALISSFDDSRTKIIIIGNDGSFWADIETTHRMELLQVLRELLVNMKKHSGASQVIIRFVENPHSYSIYYSDNGVGLPEEFLEKNGFANMQSRLAALHGKMEKVPSASGLKLHIQWDKQEK